MNWIQAMNNVVEYVEDNIGNKIEIDKLAKVAFSSPFHFQRMFYMISGITIAEYIRRRRLTLAAQELILGEKVIDTAFRYGYETPEAFSKAFKKLFNTTPRKIKSLGVQLAAYPPLSFQISIKGEKQMEYKIIEHAKFDVVGIKRQISTKDGENQKQVVAFWNDMQQNKTIDKICQSAGKLGVLGICMNFDQEMKVFDYMIAVEATNETYKNLTKATIPAATYAVFESIGPLPHSIQNVINRIYSEWFPATNYEHATTPELEVYYEGDTSSSTYRCEVWIPIKTSK